MTSKYYDFKAILVKNNIAEDQQIHYVRGIECFLKFLRDSDLYMDSDGLDRAITKLKAEHINQLLQEIGGKMLL